MPKYLAKRLTVRSSKHVIYSFATAPFPGKKAIAIGGLMHKKVTLRDHKYTPTDPWIRQLAISGLIGKNFRDFYGNISLVYGHYDTDFERGNHLKLTYTTWKISVGYRLDSYLSRKKKQKNTGA